MGPRWELFLCILSTEKMFLIKECKTYKKLLDRVQASNSLPTSVVSLAVIC
jgi:hypothetical protein